VNKQELRKKISEIKIIRDTRTELFHTLDTHGSMPDIMKWIDEYTNSQVIAVLERLEMQWYSAYSDRYTNTPEEVVRRKAIQLEKNKLKGDSETLRCDSCRAVAEETDTKCWNCGQGTFVYE